MSGNRSKFHDRALSEFANLGLTNGPGDDSVVIDADLSGLPEAAQRYLQRMNVVGRPRAWSVRAGWTGRFRMGPDQGWMPIEVWQYNSLLGMVRVFHMRAKTFGVPIIARDTYIDGRGRMLGKLFDRFTVVDGTGPEFDLGELVTFLNDAVLFAPGMLIGPHIRWAEVDDTSFDITVMDGNTSAKGRVFIDDAGTVADFSTTDRYAAHTNKSLVRTRWTTPVDGWTESNGATIPSRATAMWHMPDGPFAYAEMSPIPGAIAYNVAPGS